MPWTLLMNPWLILGLLASLAGVFGYGHHVGWTSRDEQAQLEVAKANEEARVLERQMNQKINDQAASLRKAQNEVARRQSDLSRLNAAGGLRLPAQACPAVQPAANASAAAGDRDQAARDLERQTIEALIAIAADGDRAAQQANACIDAYNSVREQLNGKR